MVARWLNGETVAAPGRVMHITSLANPIVKEISGLALAKNRKASRLFVAEGLKLVADAVEARLADPALWSMRRAWPNEALVDAARRDFPWPAAADVISVSEAVLAKITRRDNPQTVIGVFEQRLTRPATIRPRRGRRLRGAGSGARPRQSRHHHPHRRRGRRQTA